MHILLFSKSTQEVAGSEQFYFDSIHIFRIRERERKRSVAFTLFYMSPVSLKLLSFYCLQFYHDIYEKED